VKATGIVRRIDDLGRIVIPKEIRRILRIRNGESLEIYIDEPELIVLKKFSPMSELEDFAKEYVDSIYTTVKHNIFITDRDKIIAVAGPLRKKYLGKEISKYLETAILRRENFVERHKKKIKLTEDSEEEGIYAISSIISNGDCIGLVIILSEERDLTELEEKTTQIAAQFLGKYIDD
jgi:AbrB family transcriptional regulator (stage V sporulation protein T)